VDGLQVQVPFAVGHIVGVADPVAAHRRFPAELAVLGHGSSLDRSGRKRGRILSFSRLPGKPGTEKEKRQTKGIAFAAVQSFLVVLAGFVQSFPVSSFLSSGRERPKSLCRRKVSRSNPLTAQKPSVTLALSRNKSQSKPLTVYFFSVGE
jgi:hypothetical protein